MKTNQPLDKLKEENSAFGAELLSQKKQCHIVCEECDSFKLALQIVTKDLYHKNEINQVLGVTKSWLRKYRNIRNQMQTKQTVQLVL